MMREHAPVATLATGPTFTAVRASATAYQAGEGEKAVRCGP
ncbi:hypothetical protein [Nonomuraea sp. NPDC049695]